MAEPAFDWGVAEDDKLNLASMMAVTFLLARDFEAHEGSVPK